MSNEIDFSMNKLGGDDKKNAIRGQQPLITGHTVGGGERSANRKYLAKAFGNLKNSGLGTSPLLYNKNILGPFRTAYNAGDVITNSIVNTDIRYGRESSQVNGNNLSRVQVRGDGLNRNGSAMFSGNPRFVYDGSDYIRFKKLQAINKNYHDYSLGGANNSQSQHAINRVR
tara:strand:- start:674 stop:1186 length:513 start_codon:yes stop_codon:yes gene_type:complete